MFNSWMYGFVLTRRNSRIEKPSIDRSNHRINRRGGLQFFKKKRVRHIEKLAVTPERRYFPLFFLSVFRGLLATLFICYFSHSSIIRPLSFIVKNTPLLFISQATNFIKL